MPVSGVIKDSVNALEDLDAGGFILASTNVVNISLKTSVRLRPGAAWVKIINSSVEHYQSTAVTRLLGRRYCSLTVLLDYSLLYHGIHAASGTSNILSEFFEVLII